MKTSGLLIIYISENEDFDLWRVLSQVSPEERNASVKNALRSTLLKNNNAFIPQIRKETGVPQDAGVLKEVAASQDQAGIPKSLIQETEILDSEISNQVTGSTIPQFNSFNLEDFNLNDLYSEKPATQISFELVETAETPAPSEEQTVLPGLTNLINNIGEEEDPVLVDFIKSKREAEES
ncbi:hypothetical protein Sgly_1847 [Syntrophobotulus glycolicus DSM 8271]|uniref:Uncharacterized protein n=1 Tax=Syntrophobotulus glycolicus (strain DSM 8271 / FlGlyR) TaxID=645991 RepID=F0T057_SYNGF|nr:hypothetical protein [Syntrophobotulus glycolicus]ADY56144.1 hypothetical protein Sgly_1847 [Syntrophobotulus glycolicus DSM 8271]